MTTDLLDLLKMTIPAGIVLYGAFVLVKMFLQKDYDTLSIKIKSSQIEQTLPLRLQAYERMALFLERINYRELMDRINYDEIPATLFHQSLIMTIKEEFNHNLSQQIYISPELWETIRGVKEESISFINSVAQSLGKDATGFELAKAILENSISENATPIDIALMNLKKEVNTLY
ncbi:DUF7935 family protein [Flammeovirga kamogawensis]|uniref:Uncharacterized protein n=1 Tax=Flammeovirga kamogawensis TaxID=373891 RepID=A0ABX8GW23_9BACT|nr:hypothetical protein [Flammeovirga kamogawensis]MBB6461172.1 hypothetical protein [Flammeovirga kamogawensis]QWG07736.1 hypothetical protein KM029_02005 [Flammeovirga kamogawensis]TRX69543.1 hypothetical protein EO216_15940 [Flammeovirga kamogawensis]